MATSHIFRSLNEWMKTFSTWKLSTKQCIFNKHYFSWFGSQQSLQIAGNAINTTLNLIKQN